MLLTKIQRCFTIWISSLTSCRCNWSFEMPENLLKLWALLWKQRASVPLCRDKRGLREANKGSGVATCNYLLSRRLVLWALQKFLGFQEPAKGLRTEYKALIDKLEGKLGEKKAQEVNSKFPLQITSCMSLLWLHEPSAAHYNKLYSAC